MTPEIHPTVEYPTPHSGAVLVTRNFPPLVGGMETLNLHVACELAKGGTLALCAPAGCSAHAPAAALVSEVPLTPLPRFLLSALVSTLRLARRHRAEYMIAGSGLTAPMAVAAARLVKAKSVVLIHGLDLLADSAVYQALWLPAIRACDLVIANSENTRSLALSRGIAPTRVRVLHPGTDVPKLNPSAAERFRTEHGLGGRKLLVAVGRLTQRKGLAPFVQHSLPIIVRQHPDVLLTVIGGEASNALYSPSGNMKQLIIDAAVQSGTDRHLRFLGNVDTETLGAALQAADCHVFPVLTLPGDVEGFGMVAIEAAAHGLHTVAFAAGGVPDAIDVKRSGTLIEPGDYRAFATAVMAMLDSTPSADARQLARDFARQFNWQQFGIRLRQYLAECP